MPPYIIYLVSVTWVMYSSLFFVVDSLMFLGPLFICMIQMMFSIG